MNTDVNTVLKNIEELENSIAELYDWFSKLFSDNPEVSNFYKNLSLEEFSHRDLACYQRRIVNSNKEIFPDVDIDLRVLNLTLAEIKKFKDGSEPGLEAAFTFSLNLEAGIAEHYITKVTELSNEEVASLINNLYLASNVHHDKLRKLAKKYGVSA
jgi:demethoxyubiquinone hydroxylase (CLK1/Coq7/Cat5 family)